MAKVIQGIEMEEDSSEADLKGWKRRNLNIFLK